MEKTPPEDAWSSPATVQDALDVLTDMHPAWTAMIEHADEVRVFNLWFRKPVPTMASGRAVVIGDAAHPMMPTHAQGGCMSLEDAAAFETFFAKSHFGPKDTVVDRLRLYNQFRLPRITVTTIVSNAMFYRQGSDSTMEGEVGKVYSGSLPTSLEAWTPEIRSFLYGYNVFYQAARAIEFKDAPEELPENAVQHFWSRDETLSPVMNSP